MLINVGALTRHVGWILRVYPEGIEDLKVSSLHLYDIVHWSSFRCSHSLQVSKNRNNSQHTVHVFTPRKKRALLNSSTHPSRIQSPLTIHAELVLVISLWQVNDRHKVFLAAFEKQLRLTPRFIHKASSNFAFWGVRPSIQGDLGGPIVERSRNKDFLGCPGPSEHSRSGMRWTFAVTVQVLLPRQELLHLLWGLRRTGFETQTFFTSWRNRCETKGKIMHLLNQWDPTQNQMKLLGPESQWCWTWNNKCLFYSV